MQRGCSRKFIWSGMAVAISVPLLAAHAATFKTLYAFHGGNDGSQPNAALIETGGELYGTTAEGGGPSCGNTGCGTVFSMTTGGKEAVLYSFGANGNTPMGSLTNMGGTFYGTTEFGGSGDGVVFSMTPAGTEQVLHTFQGGSDGTLPFAGLVNVKGTLYGTTGGGGASSSGTVFSITQAGSEKVVYSFKGGSDGVFPTGDLIDIAGRLFGTTQSGGAHGDGVVFRVTTSGKETVLYSFQGGNDGGSPAAGLLNVQGKLYGTTQKGGGTGCAFGYGCGTVFEITTDGAEKVIYRFQGGNDGAKPRTTLIDVGGAFYGTTPQGGSTTACGGEGCGTVFKVTAAGSERVLHRFNGTGDGMAPHGALIDMGGKLVGTTNASGPGGCDCGTVFSQKP